MSVCGLLNFSSFSKELLAAALSHVDLRHALQELVNYGMLVRSDQRYAVSHTLIHTYVRKRLPIPDDMLGQIVAYYSTFLKEQRTQGLPGYAQLDMERSHIMRVM
jgi:hypothetical protein